MPYFRVGDPQSVAARAPLRGGIEAPDRCTRNALEFGPALELHGKIGSYKRRSKALPDGRSGLVDSSDAPDCDRGTSAD